MNTLLAQIGFVLIGLLFALVFTVVAYCIIDRIRDAKLALLTAQSDATIRLVEVEGNERVRLIEAQAEYDHAYDESNEDEDSDEETTVYQRPCRVRRIHDDV